MIQIGDKMKIKKTVMSISTSEYTIKLLETLANSYIITMETSTYKNQSENISNFATASLLFNIKLNEFNT